MESIHEEEAELEGQLERKRHEEEEARLAATRLRAQQIRELRLRREAQPPVAAVIGETPSTIDTTAT